MSTVITLINSGADVNGKNYVSGIYTLDSSAGACIVHAYQ